MRLECFDLAVNRASMHTTDMNNGKLASTKLTKEMFKLGKRVWGASKTHETEICSNRNERMDLAMHWEMQT